MLLRLFFHFASNGNNHPCPRAEHFQVCKVLLKNINFLLRAKFFFLKISQTLTDPPFNKIFACRLHELPAVTANE